MKNLHSARYYEKRLAKLERVADSINYPIDDNADYIRATALLPRQHGGGEAFVSGTYDYIKICKRQWENNGYFNFHCWAD